jgi:hypothetical protein
MKYILILFFISLNVFADTFYWNFKIYDMKENGKFAYRLQNKEFSVPMKLPLNDPKWTCEVSEQLKNKDVLYRTLSCSDGYSEFSNVVDCGKKSTSNEATLILMTKGGKQNTVSLYLECTFLPVSN